MSWNPYENLPPAASFSLTSSDLKEGEKLAMPQVSGIFRRRRPGRFPAALLERLSAGDA